MRRETDENFATNMTLLLRPTYNAIHLFQGSNPLPLPKLVVSHDMKIQGCQMTKFDSFLSLDGARPGGERGGAIQGKEGIKFCSAA